MRMFVAAVREVQPWFTLLIFVVSCSDKFWRCRPDRHRRHRYARVCTGDYWWVIYHVWITKFAVGGTKFAPADISCRFRLDVTLHGSCFGEDYAELGCLGEDPVVVYSMQKEQSMIIKILSRICNISWMTTVMTRVAMTKRGTFLKELLLVLDCLRHVRPREQGSQ